MGAGGMYPSHSYPNDNIGYNRPNYNQWGYTSPGHMGHMPPYGYPPNHGMGYGRGYQRPYPPANYGPMAGGFQQGLFNNQIGGGRGYFNSPRAATGGLQSAPPSASPDGNIHIHRPGNNLRPHFDDQ